MSKPGELSMPTAAAKQPRPTTEAELPPIPRGDDDTVRVVEAALSTNDRLAGHEATGDLIEHEQVFERFLSLLVVAVLHVASCLIALAIGGLEGHWFIAMIFVAFATVAALVGAFVQTIGWKAGAAVLAVEFVTWLLLAA
jgi:hypothetical protein